MRRFTIIIGCCMLLVTLQFIFSCVDSKDRKKISIAYANWAEGIAMTNLAKVILEEQGYRVTLKNADIAPIFTSVASGKADVFMDAWLPVTHADYMEQYGDRLETLGTVYEHAKLGLVVPEYVTIRSIEDLNAHKDQFKGEIIGIDAGAGLMNSADKAVQDYSLDFDLKSSSGATMVAFLKKSIDANEWIVVTGWTPHWMFSRYPLKFLEDPKEEFGISSDEYAGIIDNVNSHFDNIVVSDINQFDFEEFHHGEGAVEEQEYLDFLHNPEYEVVFEKHGWSNVKDFIDEFINLEDGAEYALYIRVNEEKAPRNIAFANTILGVLLARNPEKKKSLACDIEKSEDGQNHFWFLKRKK